MKKYKNYILLGALIVILCVGMIVISGIKPEENTPAENTEITEIYSVPTGDIISVDIMNGYGEYTVINGDTVSVKDKSADIDIEKLKNIFSDLSSVYSSEIISEVDDFSQYGLNDPSGKLVLNLKNNEKISLVLGDETPTGYGRYAKLENSSDICIVSEYFYEVILRKLDYYRNTVLFAIDPIEVNEFEFTKDGKKVAFIRNDVNDRNRNTFASFNMISPYRWEADSAELEKVFALLNQLEIKEYVEDDASDLSEYGLQNPSAYIIITNKDGSKYSLNIGKNKDADVYITANGNSDVYLINSAGFEFLSFEQTAFLQQFVSLRLIDEISSLAYTHDDINIKFDIKKIDLETHDIKVNGKLVDEKSFKAIYTEIISMSTGGVINDSGFLKNKPVLTYTFTYLNGETETIKFYEYDERKIAVVIEEATVFYVDSSQFEKRINTVDGIIRNNFKG